MFGDKILFGQGFVALKVQMGPDFVGFGAIEIGLGRGDVFLAITVFAQFVFRFGLRGGGASFGNFLGR